MKASLKLREDQKPLIRAKVPLNLCGLPLYTGVTSGDSLELALHVGTSTDAGPTVRVSYKPNNAESPFAVVLKAGLGAWGSPQGAALAMSAELNLSATGTPSFSFRLKPKFGDIGLRKDTRSIAVAFNSAETKSRQGTSISFEEKMGSPVVGGDEKREDTSIRALSYDGFSSPNGSPTDLSPQPGKLANGLSAGGGGLAEEYQKQFSKIRSSSNGASEKSETLKLEGKPNGPLDHFKDGSSDSGSIEDGFTPVFNERDQHLRVESDIRRVPEESRSGRAESWVRATTNGWSMSAHSSLPLGSGALARVRWSMRFGANAVQNFREGFGITDVRLPTLTVDKFSLESAGPFRRGKQGFESGDLAVSGLSYTAEDNNQQMGRIAAMCVSMRYQLQLLHSENKMLKKSLDDLRSDISGKKVASKATELLVQEENALRSQLFDELGGKPDAANNGKANGKSSRGKLRDGSQGKDLSSKVESLDVLRSGGNKTSGSTVTDFTSTVDPVSEELKKAIMNATGGL